MNNQEKIGIAVLGSTGNLGQRTLDLLRKVPNPYKVEVLTADTNADLLIQQALEFKPNVVVIKDENLRKQVDDVLWEEDIKTYTGEDALFQVAEMKELSVVVNAIDGPAGIRSSEMAATSGKNLILGNTESIINAGDSMMEEIVKRGTRLFPVEVLPSAVFQLLKGEQLDFVQNIKIQSEFNQTLVKTLQTVFDLPQSKIQFDKNLNQLVTVQFIDGVEKSIQNVTKEQALGSALFYPLRVFARD